MHLIQDGAPPQFTLPVYAWLYSHFCGWWIGREGPTEWPPCSRGLTASGLCHVNQRSKPRMSDEMKKVRDTFAANPV